MVAGRARTRAVELDGAMPRWRDDDPFFLIEFVRTTYGRKLVSIADVTKALGFEDRQDGDPTKDYHRVRRGMHKAQALGLLRRAGKMWGLP